nr:hypothetical protein [Streptomyces sp. TLI_053]
MPGGVDRLDLSDTTDLHPGILTRPGAGASRFSAERSRPGPPPDGPAPALPRPAATAPRPLPSSGASRVIACPRAASPGRRAPRSPTRPCRCWRIAFSRHHLELGGQARANFRAQVIDALAARLAGPDAALRAEMAVGVLLGLGALYATVQADRLTGLAPDEVADRYVPLLQPLLDGEAPACR